MAPPGPSATPLVRGFLVLLFQVHLGVPLPLVAPCKLASAELAGEGLLAGVRADVRRQMVAATEGSHADAALEGFVSRVDAKVARQLVGSGKAPVAVLRRTGVRALVDGRFARPVGVLSWSNWLESKSLRGLVVLGNVLLPTEKAGMDLLLILKGSNGLEGSYGRWVHSYRVHGLEGFMLHHPYVSLVMEEVVVWDHGKETSVHARFGGGVVVGARVG